MFDANIFILCLIVFISGLFTGFTGVSSSGILILALLDWLPIITDLKTVVGTVLYILSFPTHLGSVWEFYKKGKINYFVGNIVVMSLLAGSYIGSKLLLTKKLNINVSEKNTKYITAGITFCISIYFFIIAYRL
jgi:uncharacterized membrane protein YfcA